MILAETDHCLWTFLLILVYLIKLFDIFTDTDQRQVTNIDKSIVGNFVNGPRGPQFVPNIPPTPIREFKDYIFDQSIDGFAVQFFKSIESESGAVHNIVYGAEQESIDVSRPRYRTETNLMTNTVNSNIGGELYPNKITLKQKEQHFLSIIELIFLIKLPA